MKQPKVARPHGGVRGNNLSRSSLLFGGPFGRIFRTLPAADYGPNDAASLANLTKLADGAFAKNCPLWTYILAETVESTVSVAVLTDATKPAGPGNITQKQIPTRKLGPVGGTIVAETFLGLLKSDSSSYLTIDPLWQPSLAVDGVFGLREMIRFALAH